MSRQKLVLIISLIVSVTAIAGAVGYAQEASAPETRSLMALLDAEDQATQDPQDRHFSLFFDGGRTSASQPRTSARRTWPATACATCAASASPKS